MVPTKTGGQEDKDRTKMKSTATVTSSPSNQGDFFLTSRQMIEPTTNAHHRRIERRFGRRLGIHEALLAKNLNRLGS